MVKKLNRRRARRLTARLECGSALGTLSHAQAEAGALRAGTVVAVRYVPAWNYQESPRCSSWALGRHPLWAFRSATVLLRHSRRGWEYHPQLLWHPRVSEAIPWRVTS